MSDLTDFLLARIAEDQEVASFWSRMLAECEAKRGFLTFALEHGATVDGEFGCCHDAEALLAGGRVAEFEGDEFDPLPEDCPGIKAALPGLLLIALPYVDHPDYRKEWGRLGV